MSEDPLTAFLESREPAEWQRKGYDELTAAQRDAEQDRVAETFKLNLRQRRTLLTCSQYQDVIMAAYRMDWDEVERLLVAGAVIEVTDEECE